MKKDLEKKYQLQLRELNSKINMQKMRFADYSKGMNVEMNIYIDEVKNDTD